MGTIATVVIDGVDVTPSVVEGSVTPRLNRISGATLKLPAQALVDGFGTTPAGAGSMVKVYFQTDLDSAPVLYHHGRALLCETTCDENVCYSVLNSYDPLELWAHRPVRDWTGNFALPGTTDGVSADLANLNGLNTTADGPSMIEAMFNNSENAGSGPPSDAEGPLRLALGTVVPGTSDLSGAPVDWPMTMAQLTTELVSTGRADLVCTPIEFDANMNYGVLDLYPGNYGVDLSSSVIFQYGMGLRNVRSLRWNENMQQVCNKLWYYLGPIRSPERWQANITGDHPSFNADGTFTGLWANATPYTPGDVVTNVIGPDTFYFISRITLTSSAITEPGVGAKWRSAWYLWMVPPGGRTSPTASSTDNQLGVARYRSQQLYDVRMDVKVFDAHNDVVAIDKYLNQWQEESWFRAIPQTLYHVTLARDTGIGEFGVGDLVTVECTPEVRGGFSGAQRVFEYTISWDAEQSVPAIGELQVSSDEQGFDA